MVFVRNKFFYEKIFILSVVLIAVQFRSSEAMQASDALVKQDLGSLKTKLTELQGKLTILQRKLKALQSKLKPKSVIKVKTADLVDPLANKPTTLLDSIKAGAKLNKAKPQGQKISSELVEKMKKRRGDIELMGDKEFASRLRDVQASGNLDFVVNELNFLMAQIDVDDRPESFVEAFINITRSKSNLFTTLPESEFGEEAELPLRVYKISKNIDNLTEVIESIKTDFPKHAKELDAGITILKTFQSDFDSTIQEGARDQEKMDAIEEHKRQAKEHKKAAAEAERSRIQGVIKAAKDLIVPPQVQVVDQFGKPSIRGDGQRLLRDDPDFKGFTKSDQPALDAQFESIRGLIKAAATLDDIEKIDDEIRNTSKIMTVVSDAVSVDNQGRIRAFIAAWEAAYKILKPAPPLPARETPAAQAAIAKPVPGPAKGKKHRALPKPKPDSALQKDEPSELVLKTKQILGQKLEANVQTLKQWTNNKALPEMSEEELREALGTLTGDELKRVMAAAVFRIANFSKKLKPYEQDLLEIIKGFQKAKK